MCVAALGLLLFDALADASCCEDSKTTSTAAVCHSCSCAPHLVSQGVVQVKLVSVCADFAAYEFVPPAMPLPQSPLRPPCLAA